LDGSYNFENWDSKTVPNQSEIESKKKELDQEWEKLEYQRQRKAEFEKNHSLGDQLDYIFHHGLAKWKADIVQPVKNKYPKPSK